MQKIFLDYHADSLLPENCLVITSELALLEYDWDEGSIVFRGKTLCAWVEEFCRARGYVSERLSSPIEALRRACPGWTEDQAKLVWEEIRAAYTDSVPPDDTRTILKLLYPTSLWEKPAGRMHAAQWLLWLSERDIIPPHHQPLIRAQAHHWQNTAGKLESALYRSHTPSEAAALLDEWLGIIPGSLPSKLGAFPMDVPGAWLDRAESIWRERVAREGERFLRKLWSLHLSDQMQAISNQICYDYYTAHPEEITPQAIARLSARMSEPQLQLLMEKKPPAIPDDLPAAPSDVMRWFEDSYLPYRQWQVSCGEHPAAEPVKRAARQFMEWCLNFYPRALAGGSGQEHLAITKGKELRETRKKWVTLWVLFDGLPYHDATRLEKLLSRERTLTVRKQIVVAPLPTLTRFSKNAIMNGVPVAITEDEGPRPTFEGAILLSERDDNVKHVREAKLGDVYVLSLIQPDKTYHAAKATSILKQEVEGALSTHANIVLELIRAFPEKIPLRVCISTDHGRLLSVAERSASVPAGMQAEGRAAWGESNRRFSAQGFEIDETDGLIYLEKSRFGLLYDCAVPLGPDLFVKSDGATGTEAFAHGGLYPEEVLIPWFEFTRKRVLPSITGSATGKAPKGKRGELSLQLTNSSNETVSVVSLDLSMENESLPSLPFEMILPPLDTIELRGELPYWPGHTQIRSAKLTVNLRSEHGESFTVELDNQLETLEFQKRELQGSDLLDLG